DRSPVRTSMPCCLRRAGTGPVGRTMAVTWWPARASAGATAAPIRLVAPVRKIRIGWQRVPVGPAGTMIIEDKLSPCQAGFVHSAAVPERPMPRETLLDFFTDLSRASGTFLVHDDGFRVRSWTYAEVASAAEAFAQTLAG